MDLEVRVEPEALHFVRYPFWPASVRKNPALTPDRFTGWNPGTFPPSLIKDDQEILYIPASARAEVNAWALVQGVVTRNLPDVWSWLLEPFLDTEFTPADEQRTKAALTAHGLSTDEVQRWRERVKKPVLTANSLWWEWMHLGHFDALQAVSMFSTPFTFARFYRDSMEVALRGSSVLRSEDQPRA